MIGSLAGRVALVTGASSGIGEAAALALAGAGAPIAITARRADRLEALAGRIAGTGVEALALPGDIADEAFAYDVVARTIARFGRLDILVNSAGIIQSGGIEDADTEAYRRVVDVNLMAAVYTCKAAIPAMRAQGRGDIVNISSIAGRKPAAVFNPYSASKFAVNGMSDAMRQEVGGHGIRVCTLMPGATTTEVAEGIADPGLRGAMRQHVGKDGALSAMDVGEAILFVVSLPPRANVSELVIRPTIDTTG